MIKVNEGLTIEHRHTSTLGVFSIPGRPSTLWFQRAPLILTERSVEGKFSQWAENKVKKPLVALGLSL